VRVARSLFPTAILSAFDALRLCSQKIPYNLPFLVEIIDK
jgi:hypothetical protein